MSTETAALLAAYDEQLRTDAEVAGALAVHRLGPVRLATFPAGQGFVTTPRLTGVGADQARGWVAAAVEHFRQDPGIREVEWKTRQHDDAPGLHDALLEHGFEPDEPESIMIGRAELLAVDVPLPDGVTLRRIDTEADVRAMSAMADVAFGEPVSDAHAEFALSRLASGDGTELWVAEAGGVMVSAGRLEPVRDSDFAGIWGGSTLEGWRGRGIYRALTAARARSALALGKTLVNSDSTEMSRPILERSGLAKVSTTTPYLWRRGGSG
ncbi:GNAT family N-acetyltransferase [Nocardioides mangrovi]|uniref:GNAT family N-acetyltransferase n=1 Tax=Nocardioides mangrovi TaxID=2874580 RepID=A0ABS7U7J3_9ACTN|nr:GNAT family N-acetyltransferase [Nocardioides mangrovi]MBZ5736678.1 GNAT family N-acetyltransferase [Nocardioides mangrovi]